MRLLASAVSVWLVCAASALSAGAAGLRDPPLLGDGGAAFFLDGDAWTIAANGSATPLLSGLVPGDLISDLERAGLLGDPLFSVNWRDQSGVYSTSSWTYTRSFELEPSLAEAPSLLLVLDGVKMAADVTLNGSPLGGIVDQHLRYSFEVAPYLNRGDGANNTLSIAFPLPSKDSRNDEGRYMACSGGWDWSPEHFSRTPMGLPYLSFGIWKSVYLVPVSTLSLRSIVPLVFYQGAYPTVPLTDLEAGPWIVNTTLHVEAGPLGVPAGGGAISINTTWGGTATLPLPALAPGDAAALTLSIAVPVGAIRLWWPNGVSAPHGALQPLYTLTAAITLGGRVVVSDSRRVGFRCIAIVTDDDSDPAHLANMTGSGNFTMRYRVNGASIWARGSNVIPLDEFAGRADAAAHEIHLESAAAAGMNVLLIWGGGIFMYEAFYARADELGLLLYQDLMYSAEDRAAHMVANTSTQAAEIAYQVRRLSPHPSIAIWAGGNEIGGGALYSSFALEAVRREDSSRPIWPASPSSGWSSGVDRLWSHPLPATSGGAAEPLRVRLAPAPPPGNTDLFQHDVYYMGYQGGATTASTIGECSQLCGQTPGCTVANYDGATCLMRGFGFDVAAWGVTWTSAVYPPNTTLPLPVPPAPCRIETHGPYTGGSGWPAVNSGNGTKPSPFNPNIPPALPAATGIPGPATGPALPGTFISEFGVTSFSSFESFSGTLAPKDWGVHSPPMYWRSYSQDNIVLSHFGASAVNYSTIGDAAVFSRQLLLSQLAAMLAVKVEIETQRAGNSMGSLLWQLGEIFPTGGWGSLEYASARSPTPGQVLGGRWKPLHYALESTLFADLLVACGSAGQCYARNDSPMRGFNGSAALSFISTITGRVIPVSGGIVALSLGEGPAAISWFCADGRTSSSSTGNAVSGSFSSDSGNRNTALLAAAVACTPWSTLLSAAGCSPNGSDCILNATLTDDASGTVVASNPSLLAPASTLFPSLSRSPAVTVTLDSPAPPVGTPIRMVVSSSSPLLFVTLSTLAQGRFSRNAFVVRGSASGVGDEEVFFIPFTAAEGGEDTYTLLQATLQVQHL